MATVILLAGGIGSRMGAPIPKQFLSLRGKKIALYSFDLFKSIPEIEEIIVVTEPEYQHFFSGASAFAQPGPRRQDSVFSGLQKATREIVMAHDSARPFVEARFIPLLIQAAQKIGAAALAAPVTSTIKQCTSDHFVEKTIDRSHLWEVQTPQALQRSLFFRAFDHVHHHLLTVTDELSMVEAIGHPAQIVPSSSRNMKITTPFDLAVAEKICVTN